MMRNELMCNFILLSRTIKDQDQPLLRTQIVLRNSENFSVNITTTDLVTMFEQNIHKYPLFKIISKIVLKVSHDEM